MLCRSLQRYLFVHKPVTDKLRHFIFFGIIDEQTLRQTAADEGLLEHRQEGDGVLGTGEGGVGDHPGGVVDEGDQVGLVTLAASADLGVSSQPVFPNHAKRGCQRVPATDAGVRQGRTPVAPAVAV